MSRLNHSILALGTFVGATLACGSVFAQGGYGQMTNGGAPTFRAPGSYQRVSGRSNPALEFFGGSRALQYSAAGRTVPMPLPQPVQTAAYQKPYSGLNRGPSISPYLALDQIETSQGLPNYYLYVKPQLDQASTNQAQQVQNRRLQKQMRRATTAGIMPTSTSGGMPTTGHSTQFLNNGGYYPGLK
jgi:hypothetical protein